MTLTTSTFSADLARVAVLAVALTLGACATPKDQGAALSADQANDPIEGVNRAIFSANDALDTVLIKPVAQAYDTAIPEPIQMAVRSLLRHLTMPLVITNQLLQGDFEGAGKSTGRFLTNTILGAGGIADVASVADLPYKNEDFGITLGKWGVPDGPYLVLPLLGPSGVRDAVAFGAESFADPFGAWASASHHITATYVRSGVDGISRRAAVLGTLDDLKRNSLDYYATLRSLYRQQRAGEVGGGASPGAPSQFPDFPEDPAPPAKL